MSKEERRERRRQRKAEWRAEINRLYERQAERNRPTELERRRVKDRFEEMALEFHKRLPEFIAYAASANDSRGAIQRRATPRWADPAKVMAFYVERDRLTMETGIKHEVDHIVPLVNPMVCGLHVEFNLRVVPSDENRRKSDHFYIDGVRWGRKRPQPDLPFRRNSG